MSGDWIGGGEVRGSTRPAGLEQRLRDGVVLGAEGYVFELERRGYIKAGPYVPEVVLDFPDAVRELHREFLRAGADVMVALTYYAHREKLRHVGREGDLEEMNRQAVRIAREVAREGGVLVAGNVCNTWAYDPADPATADVVRATYTEQLTWAAEEGIDFVISETNDYLGEALIALEVSGELGLPAMVTLASTQPGRTRDGYDYVEACRILAGHGATVVGLNCDRGPRTMLPLIASIRAAVDCAVAAQPVPYRTDDASPTMQSLRMDEVDRVFPLSLEAFACTRFEMARFTRAVADLGVNYVGICCGAGPHHVRAMAEELGRSVPASKYSPSMELHPMFRDEITAKDATFVPSWHS
jgi:betaine-homocysteine S-methyltransferase